MTTTNNTYTSASGFVVVTDSSGTEHNIPWQWTSGEFTISNGVSFDAIADLLTLISSRLSVIQHHVPEQFSSDINVVYATPNAVTGEQPTTLLQAESAEAELVEPVSVQEKPEPIVEAAPVKRRRGRPKKVETPQPVAEISEPVSEVPVPVNGVPAELVGAKTLKAVVKHFVDSGMTDTSQIYQKCCEIKAEVPILSRAANLNTRIDRIAQVFLGDINAG